jgi:hypothetical protein
MSSKTELKAIQDFEGHLSAFLENQVTNMILETGKAPCNFDISIVFGNIRNQEVCVSVSGTKLELPLPDDTSKLK